MEDKTLTTGQSLDLIARMLENTRRNFNNGGGAMFLIWGYATVAVTLAVTTAFILTRSTDAMWLWCALPLIGGVLTLLHHRKHITGVRTHLDRTINFVWVVAAIAVFLCMAFAYISSAVAGKPLFDVMFIIGLLMTSATALTGIMIKFRPVTIGGFAGMAISFALPFFDGTIWQMPVFAAMFLVAQVIPGHLLNAACKREAREAGAARAREAEAHRGRETEAAQNGRAE
jgi:hypothetical protein